tara:strand:- start:311 stop:580 length:270 start_codon:yes stop_codon:yes gene_type:complete
MDRTGQPETLAQLLAGWRAARGLSLAGTAAALSTAGCHKTRAAIHHYERGGGMRRSVADAFVQAFDLDTAEAVALYEAAGLVVHMEAGK